MIKPSQSNDDGLVPAIPPPRAQAVIEEALNQADGIEAISRSKPTPRPPVSIPGYTIKGAIASGGQGHVFEATHVSTGIRVAIKVLHPSIVESADQVRFEREVESLAALRHPHIVGLRDRGSVDGHRYLVTNFIDGCPFDAFVTKNWLSVEATVKLFVKVCDAISAAHVRGIVHRDLKPSNVLVDDRGEPNVIDFGLAKLTGHPDAKGLTATGKFVGSLTWASPEQVDGSPDAVDTRSDVYALGLVLFHALTGTMPYDVSGSPRQVMETIAEATPTSTRLLGVRVDRDLDTILATCLKKESAERYQTAGELARELERFLAGEPIEAKRDSTLYVLSKLARRHRAAATAAVTIVVVSVVSAAGMTVLYRGKAEAQLLSEQRRIDAEKRADELATMSGLMNRMIGSMQGKPDARNAKFVDMLDMADAFVQEQLAGQPLIEAAFRLQVGEAYRSLRFFDQAEHHLRKALELREQNLGKDHRDAFVAQDRLALMLSSAERLQNAEALFRDLHARLAATVGKDDRHTVWVRMHLADVLEKQRRFDEARPLYDAALVSFTREPGEEHRDYFDVMNNYFLFLHFGGEVEEAATLAQEATDVLRQAVGEKHDRTKHALGNLAMSLRAAGRLSEAETALRRVIAIHRELHGNERPGNRMMYLNNLAEILLEAGKLDEAEALFREALAIQAREADEKNPEAMTIRSNISEALLVKGDYDAAERNAEAALAGWTEIRGEGSAEALECRLVLGRIALARGNAELALILISKAAEELENILRASHPTCIDAKRWLAESQLASSDVETAILSSEAALAAAQTSLPAGHWQLAVLRGLHGRCLASLGKAESAREELELSLAALTTSLGIDHAETIRVAEALRESP